MKSIVKAVYRNGLTPLTQTEDGHFRARIVSR
jgi:hypothetical protein